MSFFKWLFGTVTVDNSSTDSKPDITPEEVLRLYAEHGYIIYFDVQNKPCLRPVTRSKGQTLEMYAEKIITQMYDHVMANPVVLYKLLEKRISREANIKRVVDSVVSQELETLRSSVMVMMVRANLTETDIFVKVVETTKLNELKQAERWVLRSDAYLNRVGPIVTDSITQ